MNLREYLKTVIGDEAKLALAAECKSSIGYLRQVAYGNKLCGPELAVSIEVATGGVVTRRELRCADWHRIWPELVTEEFPAPSEEAA